MQKNHFRGIDIYGFHQRHGFADSGQSGVEAFQRKLQDPQQIPLILDTQEKGAALVAILAKLSKDGGQ